ncbi:MAG TPA: SsrA-binding protein SmpB [Candidatus Saccharimonadales bacterium]|nr:SsrA-binding protein SmpB [Candidatus Saccharimonadales bacterium]
MAKKSDTNAKLVVNRRARFDYDIHDEFKVGIVLTGPQVRSVRDGRASLRGAFVTVKNGELWLTNSSFTLKSQGKEDGVVDTDPRKILAKKKEVEQLIAAKDSGLTIVPLTMTTNTRYIKLTIATAKGKKTYDKRETIKRRDTEREAQRAIKRA